MFKRFRFQSLLSCLVLTGAVLGLAESGIAEANSSNPNVQLFTIKVRHSSKCLDIVPKDNRLSVVQNDCDPASPTQQWSFIQHRNTHSIKSAAFDKYVTVLGGDTNHFADVVVSDYTEEANQRFYRLQNGDRVQFKAVHSGYCLDISGHSQDAGANLHQYTCHNKAQLSSAGNQTLDITGVSK